MNSAVWAPRGARTHGVTPILGPLVGRSKPAGYIAVFLFLYFLFSFFTKIYFRFRNLQKYTLAAPLQGGRGFSAKKFAENLR